MKIDVLVTPSLTRGNQREFNNRERKLVHFLVKYHLTWGLHEAFDVTLDLIYRGPSYMNIRGRGVYKVTTINVRWWPLSAI